MSDEIVGLTAAAEIAGVKSHVTILNWCREYGIGTQGDDGVWRIDRAGLNRIKLAKAVLEKPAKVA